MNALEHLIRQAIEEGKFDNLDGKGKPFALQENPLEDPEWRLANKILADSGFAPGWIQKRREIEVDFNKALEELRQTWEWYRSFENDSKRAFDILSEWNKSIARFQEKVTRLNKRIAVYNLETPIPQFQRKAINPAAEIELITSG